MARLLFEVQAVRRRLGPLASGITFVVYTDAAGLNPADISTTSGGSAIPGSTVATADIDGLGPASLLFYGPPSGQDTLYLRCPSDASLGVQEIEADEDERLDALEAASGGGSVAAHAAAADPHTGYVLESLLDAKGDLYGASANNTPARLAVGADGYELTADSATTTGLRWLPPDALNVKAAPFNATGDGTTDDTTALAAAITAAQALGNTAPVYFPPGTYRTTGLTMNAYTKLVGYGATLKLIGGGAVAILAHDPGTALQVTDYSLVQGLTLLGASSSIDADTIGLRTTAPTVILRDVRARWLGTGFTLFGAQFGSAYSIKANECIVGLYIEAIPGAGGGNSWSFYDFQGTSNTVGVILHNDSIFPQTTNYFRNPSLLSNSLCAFAAFGTDNVVIDGNANEDNASAGTTLTYQGVTVKKASFHFSAAKPHIINSSVQEASVDPCIILESGSVLTLDKVSGYGSPGGRFIQCDATSYVNIDGELATTGAIENVAHISGALDVDNIALTCPPIVDENTSIPNEVTSPQRLTGFADTTGASSSGTGSDANLGDYRSVTFAASAGSQTSNRANITVDTSAGLMIVSFLARASVATTINVGLSSNAGAKDYRLPAGKWVRLVWVYDTAADGHQAFFLYPQDSAGAQVRVAKFMQRSGADSPELRGQMAAIAAGAYNPNGALLSPDNVSGLQLWLDASRITGLSDADPVTTWPDLSGNGLDPTQATAGKKPTYKTAIVNGKPVVRFDGGDHLTAAAFGVALTTPYTTFLVCQATLTGLASNMYIVASFNTGDHGIIYARASDDVYAMFSGGGVGATGTDAWTVISATYNGASSEIQVGATKTTGNAGTDTLARVGIGSNRDLGDYFTGDIAEVFIFQPAPSAAEMAGLRNYLGAKYGVTVI